MCKWGNDVLVKVKIPAELSHTGKVYWTKKAIDKRIAPIVKALTNASILTAGSCCGHGKSNGYIALHDKRVLIIKKIEDSLACTMQNEKKGEIMDDILQSIAKMFKDKNFSNEFILCEKQRKAYELYSERLREAYKKMNNMHSDKGEING